jgi:hypothetical protein
MVRGYGDECKVNNAEFVITGSYDILLWIAEFAQVHKRLEPKNHLIAANINNI